MGYLVGDLLDLNFLVSFGGEMGFGGYLKCGRLFGVSLL